MDAGKPNRPELTIAVALDPHYSKIAMDVARRFGETPQQSVERALLVASYLGDALDVLTIVYAMVATPPREDEDEEEEERPAIDPTLGMR